MNRSSPVFPRGPLIAIFALVGVSLLVAATGRMTNIGAVQTTGPVVAARDGAVVDTLVGENGFIRGTLRGLARTRRSEGIGPEDSFHLAAWDDGRLTLDDPATGRHIELEAFGSLNTVVFGRLLTAHGGEK